jgi:RNA-splicing ligase RtcB
MMVRTGITLDELPVTLAEFTDGLPKYFANHFGRNAPKDCEGRSFRLRPADMVKMCIHGAPWIADRFGVPRENLRRFHNQGTYFSEDEIGKFNWDRLAPEWERGVGRSLTAVGTDLGGNHFLELQVVEKVPSEHSPESLTPGELVFLYHGSCTALSWILDESSGGHLVRQKEYKCFRKGSWEYETVFRAQSALLNWSAAARCLVIARIDCLLKKLLKKKEIATLRCVSEAPHNLMSREVIGRQERIVYRHNAVPIDSGIPTIVSGRYDFSTYLFSAGKTPETSLHSLDHGVGSLLKTNNMSAQGDSNLGTERIFKKFWRELTFGDIRSRQQLLNSNGFEKLFYRPYLSHGLIEEPCVVTRPIATVKKKVIGIRPKWAQ